MCDYSDLSGQKDSTKPLQGNLDVRMRAPHRPTIPEQSEQLTGSQSSVDRGGTPNLVGPVHVKLPLPSKAKVINLLGLLGKSNRYYRKRFAMCSHPCLGSQLKISILSQSSRVPQNL
jgi:hypothetical protein